MITADDAAEAGSACAWELATAPVTRTPTSNELHTQMAVLGKLAHYRPHAEAHPIAFVFAYFEAIDAAICAGADGLREAHAFSGNPEDYLGVAGQFYPRSTR